MDECVAGAFSQRKYFLLSSPSEAHIGRSGRSQHGCVHDDTLLTAEVIQIPLSCYAS